MRHSPGKLVAILACTGHAYAFYNSQYFLCFDQFQVGRMYAFRGQLKKVRGQTVMLLVDPSATADDILPLAVDKHCACDWNLSRTAQYKLLYPDGQLVRHVPGSTEPFTLSSYKAFIGKPYQKLVLYICDEDDIIAGNYATWPTV